MVALSGGFLDDYLPPALLTGVLPSLCPSHNLLSYVVQTLSFNAPPFSFIYISLRTCSQNLSEVRERDWEGSSAGYSAGYSNSVHVHQLDMARSTSHPERQRQWTCSGPRQEPLSQGRKME